MTSGDNQESTKLLPIRRKVTLRKETLLCKILFFLYYGAKYILMAFLIPFLISIGMSASNAGIIVGARYGLSSLWGALFGLLLTKTRKYNFMCVVSIVCSVVAVLSVAFVPYAITDADSMFAAALICCGLYAIFDDTILGMAMTFVLSYCAQHKEDFSWQRMFGSLGYAVFPFFTTIILQYWKVTFISELLPAIIVYCILQVPLLPILLKLSKNYQKNLEDLKNPTSSMREILSTLGNPLLNLCYAVNAFFGAINVIEFGYLFAYMKTNMANSTPTVFGLSLLLQSMTETVCAPIVEKLLKRFRKPYLFMALASLGLAVAYLIYSFTNNASWLVPVNVLTGFVHALYLYPITSEVQAIVPAGRETFFFTLLNSCYNGIGPALGTTVAGFVFELCGGAQLFLFTGLACFMVFIMLLIVSWRRSAAKTNHVVTSVITYSSFQAV